MENLSLDNESLVLQENSIPLTMGEQESAGGETMKRANSPRHAAMPRRADDKQLWGLLRLEGAST